MDYVHGIASPISRHFSGMGGGKFESIRQQCLGNENRALKKLRPISNGRNSRLVSRQSEILGFDLRLKFYGSGSGNEYLNFGIRDKRLSFRDQDLG